MKSNGKTTAATVQLTLVLTNSGLGVANTLAGAASGIPEGHHVSWTGKLVGTGTAGNEVCDVGAVVRADAGGHGVLLAVGVECQVVGGTLGVLAAAGSREQGRQAELLETCGRQ
jgi:hypothetical protein